MRLLAKSGSDRIGLDQIDLDRIGSDWQTSDRINNMLKFCAFLSCVVVSSFIEIRRNVFFFSKDDYRFQSGIMKDKMWRNEINKRIDCIHNGLFSQT